MSAYICITCGVQFAPVQGQPDRPPERCPICADERQYIGRNGQQWTTLEELWASGRRNRLTEIEPGLTTINTTPSVAIGQQGHLIQTPVGNLLWESISLCDAESVAAIRALGGIAAIAISHPHFYSAMVEWSDAFGAPIWLHAADRAWVMRPAPAIRFWEGETADPLPGSGLTLLRVGGHFPGSTALLWPAGAGGRGALFSGDLPQVASDPRWVSFLYSYPNMIPLPAAEVRRIAATLAPYRFDRIYGSWSNRVALTDGAAIVAKSAERYIRHLREPE